MCKAKSKRQLLLWALSLSLTGCATPLPPVTVQPPKIPSPAPELMQKPEQSESFSERAQRSLSEWREKLMR